MILLGPMIIRSVFHPASHDGRFYSPMTQIVPQVRGRITEIPIATCIRADLTALESTRPIAGLMSQY